MKAERRNCNLLIVLATGLMFHSMLACRTKPTQVNKSETSVSKPTGIDVSEIVLERGACLGTCGVYKVTLYRTGNAVYEGTAFVQRIGRYVATKESCSQCYFPRLAELVESQGFFQMPDVFGEGIMDAANMKITAVRAGRIKTVMNCDENTGPVELWAIGMAIDRVVDGLKWEKVR